MMEPGLQRPKPLSNAPDSDTMTPVPMGHAEGGLFVPSGLGQNIMGSPASGSKKAMHAPVRQSDIALRAGCSKNTVSLALRGSEQISPARREQIERLAKTMGYVPDHAARNLRTRKSGMVGVYIRGLYEPAWTDLVNRLIVGLHGEGIRPVLGLGGSPDAAWGTSPWVQTFQELNVEAVLVLAEPVDDIQDLPGHKPVVLVGCQPNDSLPSDYVAIDRMQAARLGTEYLVSRGHRRCGRTREPGTRWSPPP